MLWEKPIDRVFTLEKPTVYLVDANHSARDEIYTLVTTLDVYIRCFTSAELFLHEIPSDKIACLVANVALPGLSGLALIERLKERNINLPTVLIDSCGDVSTAVQAMRAGVVDYIERPFADRLLLKAICDAINSSIRKGQSGA